MSTAKEYWQDYLKRNGTIDVPAMLDEYAAVRVESERRKLSSAYCDRIKQLKDESAALVEALEGVISLIDRDLPEPYNAYVLCVRALAAHKEGAQNEH